MSRQDDVAAILASSLFDLAWFRARFPDAPGEPQQAVGYFLDHGRREGMDPGPAFSVRRYLRANPDVAAAGMDALLHYLRHGREEGRICFPVVDRDDDQALPDPAQCERDLAVLRRTVLFDDDFYNASYPDVVAAGIDPMLHYVRHGAAEGRWPNPYFDTGYYRGGHQAATDPTNPLAHYAESADSALVRTGAHFDGAFYRARYADAMASPMTPLEHFLRHGLASGRVACAADAALSAHIIDPREARTTVVIPVHGAALHVAACLGSVLRNTEFGDTDSLLVIDDASSDAAIDVLLEPLKDLPGVRVVRNATNLGYTRTANLGCRLAGRDDVLLLNSDTVVAPHWLRNLKLAAHSRPRTGTVTAVSDNAGAFSVPQPGANVLPPGLDVESWARAVADAAAPPFEVPTGNGFCLYLRRAMLDAVGDFDEAAFPVGYGEENELCMRALTGGWHHLVAPSVFVHHARSGSFGTRRDALAREGATRLHTMWPRYQAASESIGRLSGFVLARHRIARRLRALERGQAPPRRRVLYVLSTRDGGIPQANADLMRALAGDCDCLALYSDHRTIELLRLGSAGYEVAESHPLSEPIAFATHVSGEYEAIVREILVRYSIDLLHIRHIAWHSLNLADLARGMGVAVVQSFHDYYCVCPTVNLIDRAGRHHPRGVTADAQPALWADDPAGRDEVSAPLLQAWQDRMQRALGAVDAFVTTSESARSLLQRALPMLAERSDDFHVIAHGRDFDAFHLLADPDPVPDGQPLRILLPGNVGLHKGAALVERLAEMGPEGALEFHLLGTADPSLRGRVVDHGAYAREDFARRVADIRPHLAVILSLAPETWCHTLTECWAAGIPVLAIDRGAVGERLLRHGGGWLVSEDPGEIFARLLTLRDPDERRTRIAELHAWQQGAGRVNDTRAMARHYFRLYDAVLARRKPKAFQPGAPADTLGG